MDNNNYNELTEAIKGLVEQTDDLLLNENANKDSKIIPTQRDMLAGIVAKHYALTDYLPQDIAKAHKEGDIHYHDLDYAPFFPMFNCMLIDLEGMLTNGFKLGNAEIETPKSITTATAVTAQIIAQVASHIYGGNTINNIDIILAPYVKLTYQKHLETAIKWNITDEIGYALERTEKETYDAFQGLEYEVNTLHCANGQTPFCTFGFGLGDSEESRIIQKSILKVRMKGLGKNEHTPVFPKLVFAIKDGHNSKEGDPYYDIKQLALECASKRMYPDIVSYDKVKEITGSFKFPMGCRSFLNPHEEDGDMIHDGRNNLGVVSINLPRIALESGDIEEFWKLLNERTELTKRALDTRIERLEGVKAKVAPILYVEGAAGIRLDPEDEILPHFKNGRSSISLGYIGIHETVSSLIDSSEHTYDSEEKTKLGLEILEFLKNKVDLWAKESGFAFSLYATPSENLCDRFCRLDQEKFGIIENINDKEYYTNSFHLDVQKQVSPFDKIDFESQFIKYSSGGFICYAEFPDMKQNLPALEAVWDYALSKVPYFGTNTPVDKCFKCGYDGEFDATKDGFTCPNCGNNDGDEMNVIRRVCGYLGEANNRPFQRGKQEEVQRRTKHL